MENSILTYRNQLSFCSPKQNIWKKDNNLIYNSIQDNKILGNQCNQGGNCTLTTIKHGSDKFKKTQTNGQISYVHGSEELILSKCE